MSAAGTAAWESRLPEEGTRVGRYLILEDMDGTLHAVSPTAVPAMCEINNGTLLMLLEGKVFRVAKPMATVLAWLDGQ